MKLSDYVIQFVIDLGVKHVFFLPGGGAMHLNDSLGRRAGDIEFTCTLHEQAAAIAAENYAKATGHIGVGLFTTGPGGTNAVTGIAGAWLDSTPVLYLSGQAKRSDLKGETGIRQGGVQEVDCAAIMAPITKYSVTVMDPAKIRYHLEKAIYLATSGRPGPVWIEIPLDVQAVEIDPEALVGFTPQPTLADPDSLKKQVARTIEYLRNAQRPIILGGNGIRLAGAIEDFRRLVEQIRIPVTATWLAPDLLPYDHPLYVGRPGVVAARGVNFAIQNSDFLLTIGTRVDATITGFAPQKLARAAARIMVDIDPPELRKYEKIFDLCIEADAGDFIREFSRQVASITLPDIAPWLERCADWKTKYPIVLPEHREPDQLVSTYFLADVLSDLMQPGDMVVSGSSGAGIEIFQHALRMKKDQRLFHTTALGSMGFALPAAIGASYAAGRGETICVEGDGSLQLNIQELATLARDQLPIKLFILSNRGFSSIRTSQLRWFNRLIAADDTSGLFLPSAAVIAEAYGVPSVRIENQSNLLNEVRAVLEREGPVLCEVMCIPDEKRIPSLAAVQRADGSMVSKPLEDLSPLLDREEFRANMLIPTIDE
jgi:acetolactate synthase I/II/III large subunit